MAQLEPFEDNDAIVAAVGGLIDAWCDDRRLGCLATLLPSYLALNGLTDGWAILYEALRSVRAFSRDSLSDAELELIGRLISATEKIVYR